MKEEKFIVFLPQLLQLFEMCPSCHFRDSKSRVISRCGTYIVVEQHCNVCRYTRTWRSQPNIQGTRLPAGNLLLAAAILGTGLPCVKTLRLMDHLNIATISSSTYYSILRHRVQPVIYRMWQQEQMNNFQQAQADGGELELSGDGRADSPGHSAKYGTYTIMDVRRNKILDVQLVQVTSFKFCYIQLI